MTQHAKRYGTLEHVKERKRILEKMIAEMPENHIQRTFICRKCFKSFTREKVQFTRLPQDGQYDPEGGICVSCARKENNSGWT